MHTTLDTTLNNGQLQYYLHDDFDAFRFELAGSLSGAGVESLYHAWRTALSVIKDRIIIIDITFVGKADESGRSLLRLWRKKGARIIARSPESRALAAAIGEAIPDVSAVESKKSWLAVAFAGILAGANKMACRARTGELKNNDLSSISPSKTVECRVP